MSGSCHPLLLRKCQGRERKRTNALEGLNEDAKQVNTQGPIDERTALQRLHQQFPNVWASQHRADRPSLWGCKRDNDGRPVFTKNSRLVRFIRAELEATEPESAGGDANGQSRRAGVAGKVKRRGPRKGQVGVKRAVFAEIGFILEQLFERLLVTAIGFAARRQRAEVHPDLLVEAAVTDGGKPSDTTPQHFLLSVDKLADAPAQSAAPAKSSWAGEARRSPSTGKPEGKPAKRRKAAPSWTQEDDERLRSAVSAHASEGWRAIANAVGERTVKATASRWDRLQRADANASKVTIQRLDLVDALHLHGLAWLARALEDELRCVAAEVGSAAIKGDLALASDDTWWNEHEQPMSEQVPSARVLDELIMLYQERNEGQLP